MKSFFITYTETGVLVKHRIYDIIQINMSVKYGMRYEI